MLFVYLPEKSITLFFSANFITRSIVKKTKTSSKGSFVWKLFFVDLINLSPFLNIFSLNTGDSWDVIKQIIYSKYFEIKDISLLLVLSTKIILIVHLNL